jgi:hypothetical protein
MDEAQVGARRDQRIVKRELSVRRHPDFEAELAGERDATDRAGSMATSASRKAERETRMLKSRPAKLWRSARATSVRDCESQRFLAQRADRHARARQCASNQRRWYCSAMPEPKTK